MLYTDRPEYLRIIYSPDYDSEESRKAVATVLRRRKAMERAIEIARSGPTGATKSGASAKKRKTAASKTKKQDAAAETEAEEEKGEA